METKVNSKGELICSLEDKTYKFREPLGKDMVAIQRAVSEDAVTMEIMIVTLATLSLDGYDQEHFLNLRADIIKDLGEAVIKTFRIFSNVAI